MAKVIHISASPRGDRSYSLRVAGALLESYRSQYPEDEISHLDLFAIELPTFDGPVLQAKYNILHGLDSTDIEREAWRGVESVIDEFKSADKFLFSVPMWNFGIPYKLKHYFDVLVQPGYTFSFDPEKGYTGLVTGKPVTVIYARGAEYSSTKANHLNLQQTYTERILAFIGLTEIRSIIVEPTLAGGPDVASEQLQQAIAKAEEMAKSF